MVDNFCGVGERFQSDTNGLDWIGGFCLLNSITRSIEGVCSLFITRDDRSQICQIASVWFSGEHCATRIGKVIHNAN